MLEYYTNAVHEDASHEADEVDKAVLLEQQTLETWTLWEQQQAAACTCQLVLSLSLSEIIAVTYLCCLLATVGTALICMPMKLMLWSPASPPSSKPQQCLPASQLFHNWGRQRSGMLNPHFN